MTRFKFNWILVLALLIVGACGDSQTPTGVTESKEPIKIGALFAVSGGASFLGEPERNTAIMIAEQINAAGGVLGRPLELVVEDTESNEQKAVTAIGKLIKQDGVCAVIGPSTSGSTFAVMPIAEENQIPLVSCAAAEKIVNPVNPWVFKTPQKDSDCVIRIFEHMKSKSIDKIAIITATTGFGQAGRDQLKLLAPQFGLTIVADETYGKEDNDMSAQLTRIRGTDAQAVVNWSIEPGQSIVPKNMRQLGMQIPLYQSHGFGNIRYVELAGEAAEGIIFPAGALLVVDTLPDTHPRKALLQQYKTDYEQRFNMQASTFGGHAYDALYLVVEAIESAGSAEPAAIRDALEKIQGFHGTAGTFSMTPDDHNGLTKDAFEMITVKDGKFVVLQ